MHMFTEQSESDGAQILKYIITHGPTFEIPGITFEIRLQYFYSNVHSSTILLAIAKQGQPTDFHSNEEIKCVPYFKYHLVMEINAILAEVKPG